MPDLPLDTLFIVGLLIASFFGKFIEGKTKKRKEFQKRKRQPTSENAEPSNSQESERGLEDLLREAFGEEIEPVFEEDRSVKPEGLPSEEPKIVHVPVTVSSTGEAQIPDVSETPIPQRKVSYRKWLRSNGLGSAVSLRRAFLIKEVLDQPLGLRSPRN